MKPRSVCLTRQSLLVVGSLLLLSLALVACVPAPTPIATPPTPTPVPTLVQGPQPCPSSVSTPSYWNPIVHIMSGVDSVSNVFCGYLIGQHRLQALVLDRYDGTGHIIDIFVYDHITDAHPTQLFTTKNTSQGSLDHGFAQISNYNTVITAEVDQNSSVNVHAPNEVSLQQDYYREFKWNGSIFQQIVFPGIFPDLTRYQAEYDQTQVDAGHQPWKLSATEVSKTLAISLLGWPNALTATVISGGGSHDLNAVVQVAASGPVSKIRVFLTRLEGNTTSGIWIATNVLLSSTPAISTPASKASVHNPVHVVGKGNAFEGVIGRLDVKDHTYTQIGTLGITGSGNGPLTFTRDVPYSSTVGVGEAEEGLVVFYPDNSVGGPNPAEIVKVLLYK